MKIDSISRFKRAFKKLPEDIQSLYFEKMHQFKDDWQHPSFRAKRVQGTDNVWEASLNMSIRFTFEWITVENGEDVFLMRNIGDHDSLSQTAILILKLKEVEGR